MANGLREFTVNKTIRNIGFTGEKNDTTRLFPMPDRSGRDNFRFAKGKKVVVYFMTKTIAP